MLGAVRGTELLSAEFLLSSGTKTLKARWIVPLISAEIWQRRKAQWGLAAANLGTKPPERLPKPEAAAYHIL